MDLSILNVDDFCEALKPINDTRIKGSHLHSKEGLFSQQIFGPLVSYSCACRTNYYSAEKGGTCKVCGVDVVSSEERRKRFAKIKLPFPILNPVIYLILENKRNVISIINDMLNYNSMYILDADGKLIKYNETTAKKYPNSKLLSGLTGVQYFIDKLVHNSNTPTSEFIKAHKDCIAINNIIVIPPDFRPATKTSEGNFILDEINRYYLKIMVKCNNISKMPFKLSPTDEIYKANFKTINKLSIDLYRYIIERLSKKKGLIRYNILGKRVDFSGRAVITPDPKLNLDECGVPFSMFLELMKPQFTSYLIKRKTFKLYNVASQYIDDCIKNNDDTLFDLATEFTEDKMCILNRQPTLHRLSMLAFKMKLHKGNTITIHPLICGPYNADFDGDQMAIYIGTSDEGVKDIKDKIGVWNNLISPSDLTSVPSPNQDVVLGIYKASTDEEYMQEFADCFPEGFDIPFSSISKKELKYIINDLVMTRTTSEVIQTIDKLKDLGFKVSTLEGFSLSIQDLYNKKLIDKADELKGTHEQDHEVMGNKEITDELKSMPFSVYIESGSRGSWDQAKQLSYSRGYVADFKNNIKPNLIRSSFVKGLTKKEYFDSCWGSRKGLLDTALSTGESGYLTRQLIYSTVFIELGDTDDCKTTDGIEVTIGTEEIANTFKWRYQITDTGLKLIKNEKELIGQTIKIRSPVYCKSKKICKKCYGTLYGILHSNQIGVIATQALGERTTQLVLRTFHLSGVVGSGGDNSSKNDDIITGIGAINRLLHKPQSFKFERPEQFLHEIYSIFDQYGSIQHIHYEVVCTALMWSKNDPWRLVKSRDTVRPEWVSILKVPDKTSWVIGTAFSNLKSKMLDSLVNSRQDTDIVLSDLFKY